MNAIGSSRGEGLAADMRGSPEFAAAENLFRRLRRPGQRAISDAAEVSVSPDGALAAFTGTVVERLEGTLTTRICLTNLETGDTRIATSGPNQDRSPKISKDGRRVAFLSDRHAAGDFQLYLMNIDGGEAQATPRVDGWIEYIEWSPDGGSILMGVAGHGADVAGGQGAVASRAGGERPAWFPTVAAGGEAHLWRSLSMYEVHSNRTRPIPIEGCNVWEAAWLGSEAIAVVYSSKPEEAHWYTARLGRVELATGALSLLHTPTDQIGMPAGAPDGRAVAFIEAVCSDRGIVAGELKTVASGGGSTPVEPTIGFDVTHVEWLSADRLLVAGHQGLDMVISRLDLPSGAVQEIWRTSDLGMSTRFAVVSAWGVEGDCAFVSESFQQAPALSVLRGGALRHVRSFDLGYEAVSAAISKVERLTWRSVDDLEIEGWLLSPVGERPFPLVVWVHGGPVFHWQPRWLGRLHASALLLLQRGFAVLFPNPRGSTGRGRWFAAQVRGDMGGVDTHDILTGIDQLVSGGVADPARLGVIGQSYGGYMASWLITQDARFAAAVAVAPITNHVSHHLLSNIPHFVRTFLDDDYANPEGRYFSRSPINFASRVSTPVLNICGALDRCTPPAEAAQFHNALVERGVESVLVTYPEEGHGVRKVPAYFDYTARVVAWFDAHMRPAPK